MPHRKVNIMVKDIAIGAGCLVFDFQAGQIAHSSPTVRHRFDVSSELCCPASEMGPATRYWLRRNTTSVMKIRYFVCCLFLLRLIVFFMHIYETKVHVSLDLTSKFSVFVAH